MPGFKEVDENILPLHAIELNYSNLDQAYVADHDHRINCMAVHSVRSAPERSANLKWPYEVLTSTELKLKLDTTKGTSETREQTKMNHFRLCSRVWKGHVFRRPTKLRTSGQIDRALDVTVLRRRRSGLKATTVLIAITTGPSFDLKLR